MIDTYNSSYKRHKSNNGSSATGMCNDSVWETTSSAPSSETSRLNCHISTDVQLCNTPSNNSERMQQILISLRHCSLYAHHKIPKQCMVIDLDEQSNAVRLWRGDHDTLLLDDVIINPLDGTGGLSDVVAGAEEEIRGSSFDAIQHAKLVVIDRSVFKMHPSFAPLIQHLCQIKKQLVAVVSYVKSTYDMLSLSEIDAHAVAYKNRASDHYFIVKYDAGLHLGDVTRLWNMIFGSNWPLSTDKIEKLLRMAKQPRHWVAIDCRTGTMVGFVATQIFEWGASKKGELMLLMTNPNYENRGVGTHLHNLALDHLQRESCNRWMFGSTYPRFFPGLPEDKKQHQIFFERRGWKFDTEQVCDLIGHLGDADDDCQSQVNQDKCSTEAIEARLQREKIWFGRIKPSQFPELHALQKRFPLWCEAYEHQADLGDYQDFLVARQDNEHGRILGSVILHTTHTSHDDRTHLVWTDEKLFTEASGSVTCVSVAEEERRRGIGTGLMIKANQILKRRGVEKVYVDWVDLVGFYRCSGYKPWRYYRTASLQK